MVRASVVAGAAAVALGATAVVTAKLLRRPSVDSGFVDINTADHERLQSINHIGPERATRIIELRQAQPFASVKDLKARVEGIGPATLARILDQGIAIVGSHPQTG